MGQLHTAEVGAPARQGGVLPILRVGMGGTSEEIANQLDGGIDIFAQPLDGLDNRIVIADDEDAALLDVGSGPAILQSHSPAILRQNQCSRFKGKKVENQQA